MGISLKIEYYKLHLRLYIETKMPKLKWNVLFYISLVRMIIVGLKYYPFKFYT